MGMRRTVRQDPLDDSRSQFATCLILLLHDIDPVVARNPILGAQGSQAAR